MEKHTKSHDDEAYEDQVIETETTHVRVRQSKRDLFLPISILAAAVMVGGAILFATLYKGGITPAQNGVGVNNNPSVVTSTVVTNQSAMVLGPRDAILGNASATVTLIEYGDYQCPFCSQFFTQTEPLIIQNYVNTGKVRFVFRNFAFLGTESTNAAEAAECAEDQNKLWAYHDALYGAKVVDENNGGGESDGFYNRTEFLKLAKNIGLDIPTFTTCIDSAKYAGQVAQEKGTAGTVGVDSTPSFFINGQLITGAQPYSVFQQTIEAALQG